MQAYLWTSDYLLRLIPMEVTMLIQIHLTLFLVCLADGQRYAERNVNVLPANIFPSSNTDEYDYYSENFGFVAEESNVHKWMVEEFPHPKKYPLLCNRGKSSTVCDPDAILTEDHADALDLKIQELFQGTPCICESCSDKDGGIIVGIALLKHMYLPYDIHPAKAVKAFAEALRQQWRLGQCDNDIIIVVVTSDRLSYTDVGQSTSDYISIQEAHRIFVANKAKFSASNFFEGLHNILIGYHSTTRTMTRPVKDQETDLAMIAGVASGCCIILGAIVLVSFLVYRKHRRLNKKKDYGEETPEVQISLKSKD